MEGSNISNSILGLLQHGCELAKKMEIELPDLWVTLASTSNPLIITQKCDEIIEYFSMAKEHLTSMHPSLVDHHHHHHHHLLLHQHHPYQTEMAATAYEHHQQGKGKSKEVAEEVSMKAAESDRHEMEHGRTMEVGGSSSLAQQRNPKRMSRNDDQGDNRRRMRMAAPQIGNTEVPPEDGFTWRKYGQKEILNAKYPRSYYRCTHQKLYNCPAKKQVQRLDDDPHTFDILYRGDHTCHMSNTAPSVPPPPPSSQAGDDDVFTTHLPPITAVHQLLSMDLTKPSSEGACTLFDPQQQQQQLLYRASSSNSILGVNHPDAGTPTVRSHQGRDHQTVDLLNNPPLLDWTEMFNSGSSGSNSMEIIFPSNDDNNNNNNKWDNKDIKD